MSAEAVGASAVVGEVRSLTTWPVKSMSGSVSRQRVIAGPRGLLGDRAFALVDRRPLRDGNVLSARNLPGILRWTATSGDGSSGPVVTGPGGRAYGWGDELRHALREDLQVPVDLAGPGSFADLADSVLVTTEATHRAVEAEFGQSLDGARWRTNLHLELPAPAHAERGWEGRALLVGDPARGGVELRLLHPCRRCAIPSWAPGGGQRLPELLRWFHARAEGVFGINARVVVQGEMRVGDRVEVR